MLLLCPRNLRPAQLLVAQPGRGRAPSARRRGRRGGGERMGCCLGRAGGAASSEALRTTTSSSSTVAWPFATMRAQTALPGGWAFVRMWSALTPRPRGKKRTPTPQGIGGGGGDTQLEEALGSLRLHRQRKRKGDLPRRRRFSSACAARSAAVDTRSSFSCARSSARSSVLRRCSRQAPRPSARY